ncbi:hypothetical protein KR222_006194, partial [Zaprionus bogoriensis]
YNLSQILTAFYAIAMTACQPLATKSNLDRYKEWPGVPDERLADAELDSAYEIYKNQTARP